MLHSFPPIIAKEPKIMILGSMPSVVSLQKQEYYGFKHNRFWKIMGHYFQKEFYSYEEKVTLIKQNHIILWDVIQTCEREGSLDAQIKKVKCNDIVSLWKRYPTLKAIICNGKKSYELYQKHCQEIALPCIVLPSTSNANRTIKEEELKRQWFSALDQYIKEK
ncbi:MAG: DNA-deoxyinosine glycosylase [Erysipelotrichaceae bacterium]|nr:DNA-deoxyinosine glycosylase [Erysipelotrichaceae bacterium]